MNQITILGCGSSGAQWDGRGDSIGVNDCWKFGKPTDYLLCVQTLQQFADEPKRLETIINSTPKKFFSHITVWSGLFKQFELIELRRWKGKLLDGVYQNSKTSPFIAVSMAYSMGYDHIKMYGVDYQDHKAFSALNPDRSFFINEMKNYQQLFGQLKAKGITIEVTEESYLKKFL